MIQGLAGHIRAFMAEFNLVFAQFWAAAFDIAVFRPWTAAHAVAYFASFLGDSAGKREVPFAYVAVHAAWSYQFRLKGFLLHD